MHVTTLFRESCAMSDWKAEAVLLYIVRLFWVKLQLFIYFILIDSPKIHYTDIKKIRNIYKSGARNLLETIGLFN